MISLTRFEDFSDDLLMTIISYCDDAYSIFRQFFQLNRRFQRILLDSRFHLLSDYFFIKNRSERQNFYAKISSIDEFRQISAENSSEIFEKVFRRLISIYFEEKFRRIEEKYQIDRKEFEEKRSRLTDVEKVSFDDELSKTFLTLRSTPNENFRKSILKNLVREKGSSLQCEDYELCLWNMSKAINECLLTEKIPNRFEWKNFVEIFEILFISNPSLVRNRDYVGNGGCATFYFLIHYLYRLTDFYTSKAPWAIVSIDRFKYQTIVEFLLFLVQCRRETSSQNQFLDSNFLEQIFHSISSLRFQNDEDQFFVEQFQFELFRILTRSTRINVDNFDQNSILIGVKNFLRSQRIDFLRHLFFETNFIQICLDEQSEDFIRKFINFFTENSKQRKVFQQIFSHSSLPKSFVENRLIFILLKKKEVGFIKCLLKSFPTLIDRLDDQQNDPLLYLTLHVNGCRHRLVELLLKNGANYRRTNIHQQDFFQTLQLLKNRTLFNKLVEHEIIQIDSTTKNIVFPVILGEETTGF